MQSDLLAQATSRIHELVNRKVRPLTELEATFGVSESMSEEDAIVLLQQLLRQRFLCRSEADLAQFLATKLSIEIEWSHMELVPSGEWLEGRGQ